MFRFDESSEKNRLLFTHESGLHTAGGRDGRCLCEFYRSGEMPLARRWLTNRIISILEQGGIHMY